MQWFSDISGNPRTRFSGFKDGRHGTEIFGSHPELVDQIVAFLVDTLLKNPVNLKAAIRPRKTPASKFFALATQPGGTRKAAERLRKARKHNPQAVISRSIQ